MAQASASSAWASAEQARQSAVAAGQDADAALKAAQETFIVSVKKYLAEEEARRKAAVEAKQKAEQDPGYQARKIYRCGQAIVPCNPYEFARWCQHNEIGCDIISMGPEFKQAMEELHAFTSAVTGLGDLEACIDNVSFKDCGSLVAEALIGAKLKALERAWDGLQLIRRGCKIIGAVTMNASSGIAPMMGTQVAAASAAKGCLEGKEEWEVFDPVTGNLITDIDHIDGDVLWELKSAIGGWDDTKWLDKHINGKFAKYLAARKQLPEFYADAPIGFRFTYGNQDQRFIDAVEARLQKLREEHPGVVIMTRWD
ncbi:hypothetical protein ACIGW4_38065 [Streptomyces sp. NPDC053513]|uniref:hypothetical protein n=1 Tax=unclassified Streptomyces TaxID=2593676 RepID=UPI0037D7791D